MQSNRLYQYAPHLAFCLLVVAVVNRFFISGSVPYQLANSAINALWVISSIILVTSTLHLGGLVYNRKGIVPLCLFLCSCWLSLIYTKNSAQTWQQLIDFTIPILVVLSFLLISSKDFILTIFALSLGCALPIGIYGVYQYKVSLILTRRMIANNPQYLESFGQLKSMFLARINSDDIFASFITSNALGIYISVAFIACVVIAYTAFKKSKYHLCISGGLIASFLIYILYLTKSKGSYGAIALALFISVFNSVKNKKIRYGILLVTVLFSVVYFTTQLNSSILSMSVRWQYWLAGLQMWMHHFFLGTGLGTFGDYYATYKTIDGWEVQKAHNNFLQLFCELGLIGGGSFLYISLCALKPIINDKTIIDTQTAIVSKYPKSLYYISLLIAVALAVLFSRADGSNLFSFTLEHYAVGILVVAFALACGFWFFYEGLNLLNNQLKIKLFQILLLILSIHSFIDFDLYVPALYWLTLLLIITIFAHDSYSVINLHNNRRAVVQILVFILGTSTYFFIVYPSFNQSILLSKTMNFTANSPEDNLQRCIFAIEQGVHTDKVYLNASKAALQLKYNYHQESYDGVKTSKLAEMFARKALQANSVKAGNWVQLANVLWALHGNSAREEIIRLLVKAVELYPYKPLYRLRLAQHYKANKQYMLALKNATEARRVNNLISDERTLLNKKLLKTLDELITSLTVVLKS